MSETRRVAASGDERKMAPRSDQSGDECVESGRRGSGVERSSQHVTECSHARMVEDGLHLVLKRGDPDGERVGPNARMCRTYEENVHVEYRSAPGRASILRRANWSIVLGSGLRSDSETNKDALNGSEQRLRVHRIPGVLGNS